MGTFPQGWGNPSGLPLSPLPCVAFLAQGIFDQSRCMWEPSRRGSVKHCMDGLVHRNFFFCPRSLDEVPPSDVCVRIRWVGVSRRDEQTNRCRPSGWDHADSCTVSIMHACCVLAIAAVAMSSCCLFSRLWLPCCLLLFGWHICIRHLDKEAGHRCSKGILTATGLAIWFRPHPQGKRPQA